MYCDGSLEERAVSAALARPAQLRAAVNFSCCSTTPGRAMPVLVCTHPVSLGRNFSNWLICVLGREEEYKAVRHIFFIWAKEI